MEHLINRFNFPVIVPFDDMNWTQEEKALMNEPSGLTYVLLYSNYRDRKTRILNFTGTSIEQAIRGILSFYKHRTFRRLLGENVYCNTFLYNDVEDCWCIVHSD